ncbi:MAG: glucosamine-6-phosphate deaminase [Sedimentisphaerales bacterium]
MRVIIQPSYELVSKWAAFYVAGKIKEFQPTGHNPFVLGLPTGSSPLGMYKELIRLNNEKVISFENVVTFNMDEYVNLPREHPESYYSFMWNNFFGRLSDIKKENVNMLDGNATDLEAECSQYEAKIKEFGGVRLFVGGIGRDGHIAFNEPGSSLSSSTRVKTLTFDTIKANSRFFDGDIDKVPGKALTVGVGTIMDAQEVLIIVNGHGKARALRHAIEGSVNHMWTISALQMHPKGIIVCDELACAELKVGTYKYYKEIESASLDPQKLLGQ